MGAFGDWAEKYYECGYSVIPVTPETKAPNRIKGWQQYCNRLPTEEEMSEWVKTYHDFNIGLCLGPASGIVAFDYDYDFHPVKCDIKEAEFMADKRFIEDKLLGEYFPNHLIGKVGRKGWTRFFKYSDQTNMCADRYGVRLFDFLSTGKQTVIPPSIHMETGRAYFWQGESILDLNKDEFPDLPQGTVQQIKDFYQSAGTNTGAGLGGRHGDLFMYMLKIIDAVGSVDELTEALLDRDKKLHGTKTYFDDPKYWKSMASNPQAVAQKWVLRTIDWKVRNNPDWEFGKKKPGSNRNYEAYELFFNKKLSDCKRDFISGKLLKPIQHDIWTPVINDVSAIKSYAMTDGLNKANVEDNLNRYILEQPRQWLIDIPEWDGKDRIKELDQYIKINNTPFWIFEELLKEWGANIFRRIENPQNQNKCIILKGDQGLGKDRFIQNCFGAFGPYYTKFTNQQTEKDIWTQIAKCLIIHLEEFDQTAKLSIPFLKDLITRDFVEVREAYGRDNKRHLLHYSFISSVNIDSFFRDPTGNRRFQVFDVAKIDWRYPKKQSPQIIAQFKYLYEQDFWASKKAHSAMSKVIEGLTPDPIEDQIIEHWDAMIKLERSMPHNEGIFSYGEIKNILADISKLYGWRQQSVSALLKRRSRKVKQGGKMKFLSPESPGFRELDDGKA